MGGDGDGKMSNKNIKIEKFQWWNVIATVAMGELSVERRICALADGDRDFSNRLFYPGKAISYEKGIWVSDADNIINRMGWSEECHSLLNRTMELSLSVAQGGRRVVQELHEPAAALISDKMFSHPNLCTYM